MTDPRYARQSSLLHREGLERALALIAGCGAVGRQLCHQLASAGQMFAKVYDHDSVEIENVGPQGWREEDVGVAKVCCCERELRSRYSNVRQEPSGWTFVWDRAPVHPGGYTALFLCVDNMEARRQLFEAHAPWLRENGGALFDVRVSGEIMRLLCCCKPEHWEYYPRTLYSQAEAMDVRCTARMTIHLANLAAGMMMQNYAMWLRGQSDAIEPDILCNWLAFEMRPYRD